MAWLQPLTLALLLLQVPLAEAKKGKFMANYPGIIKFLLFWWCAFVFVVMAIYVIDYLLFKFLGPAKVVYSTERSFASSDREACWKQFVDPSAWSPEKHPIAQTADIRMVKWLEQDRQKPRPAEDIDPKILQSEEISSRLEGVPFGRLKPGLGLELRHKAGTVPRAGTIFCARECVKLEEPADGPWCLELLTTEAGGGYPFLERTETSRVELWPPGEDGRIRCRVSGEASVMSRVFRWWSGLQWDAQTGSEFLLQTIADQVAAPKKLD